MNICLVFCNNLSSIDISSFRVPSLLMPHATMTIFNSEMPKYGNIKINKEFYNRTNYKFINEWNITFV